MSQAVSLLSRMRRMAAGVVFRGLEGPPDDRGVPDTEHLDPGVHRYGLVLSFLRSCPEQAPHVEPQLVDVADDRDQVTQLVALAGR
ncbi:hypothetical protein AB0L75_31105 [Streptomyces sp. NPDC052101]|uniref:hypothetical protein n=1 Tax=Streptomyces sp. NPDC052101 TaxID=3155763 RepID=UPI003418B798